MFNRLLIAPVALLVASSQRTSPTTARAPSNVVVLRNGRNVIDLLGDGTRSEVFVAWRGNYNAHGGSSAAFYVFASSDLDGTTKSWQIVPFFGGSNDRPSGSELYTTSEGADCTLGDIRVIRRARRPVQVVLASRELGNSFADPAPVRFAYYELARNTDGVPGWPPFYFKFSRSVQASRPYCDVNEAFERELHLGTAGLGHAEGGR